MFLPLSSWRTSKSQNKKKISELISSWDWRNYEGWKISNIGFFYFAEAPLYNSLIQ